MKLLKTLGIAAGAYWLYSQYQKKQNAYKSVTAKVVNATNVKAGTAGISFNMDLLLTNPSDQEINLNGNNIVKLQGATFSIPNGQNIGSANFSTSEISLPPKGSQTITGIPVTIPAQNPMALLQAITNPQALQTQLNFEVVGQAIKLS